MIGFFLDYGLEGLRQINKKLGDDHPQVYPLLGLGYYEIILWVEADNFKEIFPLVQKIRSLPISAVFKDPEPPYGSETLFITSITIPLVSYHRVIGPGQYKKLQGDIKPVLKIKCAPGHETEIADLLRAKAETRLLLGVDDLISIWKNKEKLEVFLPFLVQFREHDQEKAVIDTVSHVSQIDSLRGKKNYRPPIVPKQQVSPLTPLFEILDGLSRETGTELNQFLLGEISNLCCVINTQRGTQTMGEEAFDFIYTLNISLPSMLEEYREAVIQGHREKASILERNLLKFIELTRAAISQQCSSTGYSDYHEGSNAPTFASSLAPIIKAISVIPHQLFDIISRSPVPTKLVEQSHGDPELKYSVEEFSYPWHGFSVLDLPESYQIARQAEIIQIPYNDIFRFLNLITLSHECSHGYYVRIDFEALESDILNRMPSKLSNLELSTKRLEEYKRGTLNTAFELFANWFDYRHFFQGKRDFYLWSIWRTYLNIPRVFKYKKEYWARSLFIWLCDSWSEFRPTIDRFFDQAENYQQYEKKVLALIPENFQQMIDFLRKRFKGKLGPFELTKEEMQEIPGMLFPYLYWGDIFEKFYVNQGVLEAVNRRYPLLDVHIDEILAGRVVTSSIENPFLLLREILRRFFKKDKLTDPQDKVTVAFLFSYWEASRKFRRSLDDASAL